MTNIILTGDKINGKNAIISETTQNELPAKFNAPKPVCDTFTTSQMMDNIRDGRKGAWESLNHYNQ